jgi:ribosomal protein S18 acetylase RimI-like enzyme
LPSRAFLIRRAEARDLADVTALWTALLARHAELDPALRLRPQTEGETRGLVRVMLGEPDLVAFLGFAASAQGLEPAQGLCLLQIDRAPPILEERSRAQIGELYVREGARRKGLGRALAQAALAHAHAVGVRRLEVRISARNPEGQSFWRALGFRDFMDVLDLRL